MSHLISIIIPTYNSESTLAYCLDRIVQQTFNEKEVIILDGHSTDNTIDIIKSYASKYKYIKWFSEKDDGVYEAMNKGIKWANGEWLYFLGSDDYLYDKNVLADVVNFIDHGIVDIVYADVFLSGRSAIYGGEFSVSRLHSLENLCHQAIFYHRSIFEKLGCYNLKYKINADWDLNIRCFRHPDLVIKYYKRTIAVYNELTGISGKAYDQNLYDEIPLLTNLKLRNLQSDYNKIAFSREYKIGLIIYSALKRAGIIKVAAFIKKVLINSN